MGGGEKSRREDPDAEACVRVSRVRPKRDQQREVDNMIENASLVAVDGRRLLAAMGWQNRLGRDKAAQCGRPYSIRKGRQVEVLVR
jgi:hypothetical protein